MQIRKCICCSEIVNWSANMQWKIWWQSCLELTNDFEIQMWAMQQLEQFWAYYLKLSSIPQTLQGSWSLWAPAVRFLKYWGSLLWISFSLKNEVSMIFEFYIYDLFRNIHECGGTDRLRNLASSHPIYSTRICKYASQVVLIYSFLAFFNSL